MTVTTLQQPDFLPALVPSSDPSYDWEGRAAGRSVFRLKQTATDLRVGVLCPTGERFGYAFPGFVSTQQTRVGSAASFRMGGTTLSFKVINGQVKERIRWATLADVQRRTTINLATQGCHFEMAGDGGLFVWSDSTNTVVGRVPAPTVVDNVGRSDTRVHYELAPDGSSVDLVIDDPTWFQTAAFPVFIDPTTVTSTSTHAAMLESNHSGHMFRMADGKLVALWVDNANYKLFRSTSTDGGASWTTGAAVFSTAMNTNAWSIATQVSDTIYGILDNGNGAFGFSLVYASGAFTDTLSATDLLGNNQTQAYVHSTGNIVWDSGNSVLHAAWLVNEAGNAVCVAIAMNTSLAKVSLNHIAVAGPNADRKSIDLRYAGGNVVLLVVAGQNTTIDFVRPLTYTGGATYTNGTDETGQTADAIYDLCCAFDQNGLLDIFWTTAGSDPGSIKTIKRTGTNTYSAVTTLESATVPVIADVSHTLTICETGNANGDIFLVYPYSASQTNGEIYSLKRQGGVWQSRALVAGGSATGWNAPCAIRVIQSDGIVHMLYFTNSTLKYDGSLANGNAPSAPTSVTPTGAITTTTPTCTAIYQQTQAGDNVGKYRVLVKRVSDSTVFWDTGSSGTTWGGAAIAPGGTFSIAYAGTTLVKGTQYQIQISFWDAIGSFAGPLSTAVNFTPEDAPTCTVTAPAGTVTTSGPLTTWNYGQAQGFVQTKYQVVIRDSGDTTTIYDSGLIVSAATAFTVPGGTLANNTSYLARVTVTDSESLTGSGTHTFTTAFIPPGGMI